jgi:hypothetical protein
VQDLEDQRRALAERELEVERQRCIAARRSYEQARSELVARLSGRAAARTA